MRPSKCLGRNRGAYKRFVLTRRLLNDDHARSQCVAGGHSGPVAFNIVSSGEDKNDAWLVAGGALYAIDLKTGKATMVGKIEGLSGNLGDIAWVD